jgi:hypothetical protein
LIYRFTATHSVKQQPSGQQGALSPLSDTRPQPGAGVHPDQGSAQPRSHSQHPPYKRHITHHLTTWMPVGNIPLVLAAASVTPSPCKGAVSRPWFQRPYSQPLSTSLTHSRFRGAFTVQGGGFPPLVPAPLLTAAFEPTTHNRFRGAFTVQGGGFPPPVPAPLLTAAFEESPGGPRLLPASGPLHPEGGLRQYARSRFHLVSGALTTGSAGALIAPILIGSQTHRVLPQQRLLRFWAGRGFSARPKGKGRGGGGPYEHTHTHHRRPWIALNTAS